MGQPRGLFLALSALVLTACTTTQRPKPPVEQLPDTPTASAERLPGDRDERAVFAALRQLDMCALLDAASDVDPTFANLPLKAYSPYSCAIAVDKTGDRTLRIGQGGFEPRARKHKELVTLGDAKAYEMTGNSPSRCIIVIPVSFRLAVSVYITNPNRAGYENCIPTRQVATAVVTLLADPATARMDPIWDQCTLIAGARHEPPPTDVTPQHPLPYKPNEKDTP